MPKTVQAFTQISRYITEVGKRCKNHNIGKIFIFDLFYCAKVARELNQLNFVGRMHKVWLLFYCQWSCFREGVMEGWSTSN